MISKLPLARSIIEERQFTLPDKLLPAAAIGFVAGLIGYAWEGLDARTAVCTFNGTVR